MNAITISPTLATCGVHQTPVSDRHHVTIQDGYTVLEVRLLLADLAQLRDALNAYFAEVNA